MDAAGGVSEPAPEPARADGEDLRQDRDCGLGRCLGADVEAGRTCQAKELALRHALCEQAFAALLLCAARTERADVERIAVQRPDERRDVEALLMREYEAVVRDLEQSKTELQEKILDLEKFEEVVVGRELKMIALEKELEGLQDEVKTLRADGA